MQQVKSVQEEKERLQKRLDVVEVQAKDKEAQIVALLNRNNPDGGIMASEEGEVRGRFLCERLVIFWREIVLDLLACT